MRDFVNAPPPWTLPVTGYAQVGDRTGFSGCEPGGIPGGMDLRPGKSGDDTGPKVRPEAREGIPKIMCVFETRDEFIQEFVGRHIQWIVAKKTLAGWRSYLS